MQDKLRPGLLVKIPFGRREIVGVASSFEMHRLPAETKKLKELAEILTSEPVMSEKQLALANYLANYYVVPLGLVVKTILPKFVKTAKDPGIVGYEKFNPDYVLTDAQRAAVSQIAGALGRKAEFLLHGVTGSGKTEVYMQVMERVLDAGRQVIMLVPEISLTVAAIERFARRFGIDRIALLHSRLKDSQRLWMWQKVREGQKQIIIGPRSAVFAPVQDLGLIIMDEEHDPSFKQFDQNPKYDARAVAKKLSELWSCPLVLGDATPSVPAYFRAVNRQADAMVLTLPHRIMADVGLPKVRIADMRREIAAGNFSIFSEALKSEIVLKLKQKKQIILFLNRRGAATFVMCRDCGYVATCVNCSLPLVYHLTVKALICHHCGKNYPLPGVCPSCSGARIKYFGSGTEAVEEELKKFLKAEFPEKELPEIVRMDRDTTEKDQSHEKIYKNWSGGKTRVLIGTQMISKGWDVSHVGLVGIISADTVLHLPDFRANERTFQILTQVAGRAGRGSEPGAVILQTYTPDNFAIQAAKTHDYEQFFKHEIMLRREHSYPPFAKLVKLTSRNPDGEKAWRQALAVKNRLIGKTSAAGLEIIGPVPAFLARLRGQYRFQLILKMPITATVDLYNLLYDVASAVDIDVDPDS